MSVTDITMIQYNGSDVNGCHEGGIEQMSRWEPNARGRLEQAALDLYQERGFEQTMVTEIAERAGLTERTFFRYFADFVCTKNGSPRFVIPLAKSNERGEKASFQTQRAVLRAEGW
jgi:hypothetical protein